MRRMGRKIKVLITTGLAVVWLTAGAQDRGALETRKKKLEAELHRTSEQIEAIDQEPQSRPGDIRAATTDGYFIEAYGVYDVNSAGGVEPTVTVRNPNAKSPIRYARIALQLFDRVGKVQRSSIGREAPTQWVSITGPLRSGDESHKGIWEPVWYNHTGWCIAIVAVQIEFFDGTKRSFSGKTLSAAIKSGIENSCPVEGPRYHD